MGADLSQLKVHIVPQLDSTEIMELPFEVDTTSSFSDPPDSNNPISDFDEEDPLIPSQQSVSQQPQTQHSPDTADTSTANQASQQHLPLTTDQQHSSCNVSDNQQFELTEALQTPNWQEPVDEISKLSTVQSSHIAQSDALVDRVVFKRKPVIFQSLTGESGVIRQFSHTNLIKDNSSHTSLYFRASHELETGDQTVRLVSEAAPSESAAFIKCCPVLDSLQIKSINQDKISTEYSAVINNNQNVKYRFK